MLILTVGGWFSSLYRRLPLGTLTVIVLDVLPLLLYHLYLWEPIGLLLVLLFLRVRFDSYAQIG